MMQDKGARNVLVSMAGDGALLLDEHGTVYRIGCPKGKVVNSVGAGDSMVAGFVAGYLQSGSDMRALRLGTACGSATAFSLGLATKARIDALLATMRADPRAKGGRIEEKNMRITELFTAQSIALDYAQRTGADHRPSGGAGRRPTATSPTRSLQKGPLCPRGEGSTYVDNGITVPHAKCDCVTRPSLAALRLSTPCSTTPRTTARPTCCLPSRARKRQPPRGYAGPHDADAHE